MANKLLGLKSSNMFNKQISSTNVFLSSGGASLVQLVGWSVCVGQNFWMFCEFQNCVRLRIDHIFSPFLIASFIYFYF